LARSEKGFRQLEQTIFTLSFIGFLPPVLVNSVQDHAMDRHRSKKPKMFVSSIDNPPVLG
jgi:hypothetical protein